MTENKYIHPMQTEEIIHSAFELYRRHLPTLLLICAPAVILNFASILYPSIAGNLTTTFLMSSGGSLFFGLIVPILIPFIIFILGLIASCAILIYISNVILSYPTGFIHSYRQVLSLRFVGKLVAATLLLILIFILILIVGLLFSAFLPCLVVIPLAATIWLFIRMYCYIYAIVLEKKGIVQSLKRSWYLTSGNFWYILRPTLIIAVPILLVSVILTFIFGAIFGVDFWMDWSILGGGRQFLFEEFQKVSVWVNMVISFFTFPFGGIVSILIYYSLRCIQENYHVDLMAKELGYKLLAEILAEPTS